MPVREDLLRSFPDLFGEKVVNGRRVSVETLIDTLSRDVRGPIEDVLHAHQAVHHKVARGDAEYDFLPAGEVVRDPDGGSATVGDIRQGMLDGFAGKSTPAAWRVGSGQPIPADVMRPGLEGTGPAIDLGMAMGALNSGAASWMWDWEDAGGDYRDQLYRAWRNLKEILAHEWDGRVFEHPTKRVADTSGGPVTPRRYSIDVPPGQWPTIFHRVPGLHLRNRQITVDGREVPAIVPALVIHTLNNFESQRNNGSGVYFYIPKLESWQAARIVGTLLRAIESAIGVERGTLKVKVLNERAEFVLQQEVIHWVLRANLLGPNVGRWDYLNSREDMFHHDPAMVIPNPMAVTMTEASMTAYTRRNALLATLCGAMPIGGMAAQMQNPKAPEHDPKALRDIWFDKLRERLTGLLIIDGRTFDTYRQSWVATTAPQYVAAGREPLVAPLEALQAVVDQTTPDERRRLEAIGVIESGRISPMRLSQADLAPAALFSRAERDRLLARPDGPTTEEGLRYAMYMATEFMYQQLQGNNAAAIDDPLTGLRFMNDLATYEIFWHFLYLTVYHGVTLTADGPHSKSGERVTPALFLTLLDERQDAVKALFSRRGIAYDQTDAQLVLDILRRQVVETRPDGTVVPQSRWVKYGSRVLLSLIERSADERRVILDAIFDDREAVAARVEAAAPGMARDMARRALDAHDYVHDVFVRASAPSVSTAAS